MTTSDQIHHPKGKFRRNFQPQPLEHTVVDHLYGRPSNRHELTRSVASNGPTGPVGPVQDTPAQPPVSPHVLHIAGGAVAGMMLKGLMDGR